MATRLLRSRSFYSDTLELKSWLSQWNKEGGIEIFADPMVCLFLLTHDSVAQISLLRTNLVIFFQRPLTFWKPR